MAFSAAILNMMFRNQDEYNRKVLKSMAKKWWQNDFSRGK